MLLSTARGVSSTPRDAVPHTAGGAAHPWLACEGACEGGNVCCANVRYPHRRYTPAIFGGDGVADDPESVFKIVAAAGFPEPMAAKKPESHLCSLSAGVAVSRRIRFT